MHAEPDSLAPGTLLAGKYRLERLIGKGGFGAVFRATNVREGGVAAVKVLSRSSLDQSGGLGRFHREADLASRLKHTNTVRVLDAGEDAMGWLYIAFELLVGRSVEQALTTDGAMSPERAASIASDALSALDEAHKAGIIHRDLKPANLFLAESADGSREVVKILDFGIAKSVNAGTLAGLTRVGSAVGTPIYMAPEQLLGQSVGPQSDLFSLGIVLADMVLGASPYGVEPNAMKVVSERIGGKPVPLPPALESSRMGLIIARATQPEVGRRFQSASEMRSALAVFAPTMLMDGRPSRDVRSGPVIGRAGPPDPSLASAKTEAREIDTREAQTSAIDAAQLARSSATPFVSGADGPGASSAPRPPRHLAATADELHVPRSLPVAPSLLRAAKAASKMDDAPPATIRDPQGGATRGGPLRAKRPSRSRVGVAIAVVGFLALVGTVLFLLYDRGVFDDLLGRKPRPTGKRRTDPTSAPAPSASPDDAAPPAPPTPPAPPAPMSTSSALASSSARPTGSANADAPVRAGRVACPGIDEKDVNEVMVILQKHGLEAKLDTSPSAARDGNYVIELHDTDNVFFMRPSDPDTFEAAFGSQRWEDSYRTVGFGERSAIMFMVATTSTDAALTELCAP